MKSRFAILGMLVAGLVFSTAGAGLAVSGINQSGTNAAVAQYGTPTPTPVCTPTPPPTDTTPTIDSTGGTGGTGEACGEGGVLQAEARNTSPSMQIAPASEGGVSPAEESGTQPARQAAVAAQTSQLPFTGFAAIPVLLGGLALLTGGLLLRRRTHAE